MTNVLRLILLFLLSATLAPVAAAQGDENLDKRSFTCPLGGKTFTQEVGYSAFPLITLPDGSWLGDALMDVQIPVCPDNGLVILPDYAAMEASDEQRMTYGDYSVAERARLPGLIADPAYLALKSDNRHAQAYWLATKLGRPASTRFHLLQRSTWATIDPMLRKRRVEQFAADGPALIDAMDESADARRLYSTYIVNALRELGRFDEALARLDANDSAYPLPDSPPGTELTIRIENFVDPLRTAIAERDDDRFPVDLLDQRIANDICTGTIPYPPYDQNTPKTKAACARRKAAADRQEAAFDEAMALGDDPENRDRLCAATPAGERSAGLAQACDGAQAERDRAAGDALAMQGRATAATCEATPETERKGALFHACVAYDILVESQLGEMLVDDSTGFTVICGEEVAYDIADRDRRVFPGCGQAQALRDERAIKALLEDPAALEPRCKSLGDGASYGTLEMACVQFHSERLATHIQKLATDDAAYQHECARFGDKPRDLFTDAADELEVVCDQARYRRSHSEEFTASAGIYAPIEVLDLENADGTSEAAKEMSAAVEKAIDDADAIPERRSFLDDGSELSIAARDAAAAIIARAKAENTYPRRPKGQRD